MAVLERGKGPRRHVIEVARQAATLCLQETEGGHPRLPGYRQFPDAASATAALVAEVRARLTDGMKPADDEARRIAEAMPPRKAGPPTLPIRQDLGIYNEATGFVVTSRRMAGKTLDAGSAAWKKAVGRGDLLPVTLVQDDPFVLRVVAGGPLTPQEDEEWVARVDWHLNVPDGRLCVTGGSVFSNEDYDADDASFEPYVGEIAIPKGRYRAALYTHVHGVNGDAVLDFLAGGHGRGEALDAWFARTRPADTPPSREGRELVDFLLHLEPIDAAPDGGLSTLPDEGWFDGSEQARTPDRCPLGLVAMDVVRTARQEAAGGWTFVRHVWDALQGVERRPVSGGPVRLPLASLGDAARLAWFSSRLTTFEVRLTPPAGVPLDLAGGWPEGCVAVDGGGVARLFFDVDVDVNDALPRLAGVGARLAAVPDGSILELCCESFNRFPGAPEDTGRLCLAGEIAGGEWRIARAAPEVDAGTLSDALCLAGEIAGTAIAVRDGEESAAILGWARRNFGDHLKGNPPALRDGAIRCPRSGHEVALMGVAAFATRFATTWPVVDLSRDAGA